MFALMKVMKCPQNDGDRRCGCEPAVNPDPARQDLLRLDGQPRYFDRRSCREFHFANDPEIVLSQPAMPQPAITLYTSANCGYCMAAKNFLRSRSLSWNEVRIDLDAAERERMLARARRTSVPQIFIGDTHVGGYDDLIALHRAGKLDALVAGDAA
jgi:glutaredoxin 3